MKANLMNKTIEMSKTEANKAGRINSNEFNELNTLRTIYPTFEIVIKTSSTKKKSEYKGLTYEYILHTSPDKELEAIAEFDELILISQCHSKAHRYPTIKKWFLERYPEVAKFGCETASKSEENQESSIVEIDNKVA